MSARRGRRSRHFIISGTTLWNPGDDFVRDGVIAVLRAAMPESDLNLHFYNFSADRPPHGSTPGIGNDVSPGDLARLAPHLDGVIVAGLSAGDEIKPLYSWVLDAGLQDRVWLIGAGYENAYCARHIVTEPEATIFRHARAIIGRTAAHPALIEQVGNRYTHLNCPALLSVPRVRPVAPGHRVQRIGVSIQLPHAGGVNNQSCGADVHALAMATLDELAVTFDVEVIAHHKSEYAFFLEAMAGRDIPVRYSSFARDLHDIYATYDLVVTTRLHSALYANGHGIPGVIINDTDRHTHALAGFPHATWVATRDGVQAAVARWLQADLSTVAHEAEHFKADLLQRYARVLAPTFAVPSAVTTPQPDAVPTFDSERKEQAFVRGVVKPGMTVFDVGAHHGKYLRLFRHLVGDDGVVHAFEPTPASADTLAGAITRGGWHNVHLTRAAVSDHVGQAVLHEFPERYSSWNGLGRAVMPDPESPDRVVPITRETDVPVTTLDAYCEANGIRHIDYLKLDVEGAEGPALRGARRLLARQAIGVVQFEISAKMLEGMGTSAREAFAELEAAGYACHAITPDGSLGPSVSDSDAFYENYVATPRPRRDPLPVHFVTIVLNGEPFIREHLRMMLALPFTWHWHVVEGVAAQVHDTAWSASAGGHVPDALQRDGLSVDGTSDYLDAIARAFPDRITVYRTPGGVPWDGKRAMMQEATDRLPDDCLLWQLDSDELWTADQVTQLRAAFLGDPARTAAHFWCHYYVGPDRVIATRETYGNQSGYEWRRVWRYRHGDQWAAHEPPQLLRPLRGGAPRDVAMIRPFRHDETEALGLVFRHFAYATEAQVAFKEAYYGYRGAVAHWRALQEAALPVSLATYLPWVRDDAMVQSATSLGLEPMPACSPVPPASDPVALGEPSRVLIVRTDSVGDAVLASGMLEPIRRRFPGARLAVLCQAHVAPLYEACPHVDTVMSIAAPGVRDAAARADATAQLAAFDPDLVLHTVRSRDVPTEGLVLGFRRARHVAIDGDTANCSAAERRALDPLYDAVIPADPHATFERAQHQQFLRGAGIASERYAPEVWVTPADERWVNAWMSRRRAPQAPLVIVAPYAQHAFREYPELASAIRAGAPDAEYVIVGAARDAEAATALAAELGPNATSLAGATTVRQLAALVKRAQLVVGMDSAVPHMAGALGVPHVVVLGGGHFGRFFPDSPLTSAAIQPMSCFGCNWRCIYSSTRCITEIPPVVVAFAIAETLRCGAAHPRVFHQDPHRTQGGVVIGTSRTGRTPLITVALPGTPVAA